MTSSLSEKNNDLGFPNQLFQVRTLLVLGSLIHIFYTISVFLIGKFQILPNFISTNGILKGDAESYISRAELLSQRLSEGNLDFLLAHIDQIHLRFYTLAYHLQSGILGSNVLTFEIINLPLFLCILFLVYKIGENLFDSKVGFVSAYIIIFFPTFILHTTQPLRNNLFVAIFLFLIWQLLSLFSKKLSVFQALISALIISLTFISLWFVRDAMFLVYLGIIVLALVLIIVKNFRQKWELKYNLIPILFLLISAFLVPKYLSNYLPLKSFQLIAWEKRKQGKIKVSAKNKIFKEREVEDKVNNKIRQRKPIYLRKINTVRFGFSNSYKNVGSNIDKDYLFEDTQSLIFYLPKAFAIGFFAPFPNMWFQEGAMYGKTGRIIAGLETLIMYLFILLACIAFIKNLSEPIIFVSLSIFTAFLAFGLTVINVGAIYRLRYAFWILLIILGVKGLLFVLNKKESFPVND